VTAIGQEKFDGAHVPFLTDGTGKDIDPADPEQLFLPGFLSGNFFDEGLIVADHRPASGNVVLAVSVCQQAEVTNPDIPRGQDMEEESSDKFICPEGHGLLAVTVCIISPEEGDHAVSVVEESVIADGNPMGISAKVLEDPFGAIKGRFAIDDPLLAVETVSVGFEGAGVFEITEAVRKDQMPFSVTIFEKIKELASEQGRHDPHGHKKPLAAGHPASPVRGETAAGDDTVDVGMVQEILSPGVENTDNSYRRAEMLLVLCEFYEGLGGRAKEQIVQDLLIP